MSMIVRKAADEAWPLRSGWGNHRILVKVDRPYQAVLAAVEWRRRDFQPEKIAVRVKYQAYGEEIYNVAIRKSTRLAGEIVFQAPYEGIYEIYYMPFRITGKGTHVPVVEYQQKDTMVCDGEWERSITEDLPKAELLAFEGRTDFDRFNTMEVIAAEHEVQQLMTENPNEAFLLFPEDRTFPIRMLQDIPQRWAIRGPESIFQGSAQPGEYYVFQIGVWALQDVSNLKVSFVQTHQENGLSEESITCFNTSGVDCLGRSFNQELTVISGAVQPLWIGIDLPDEANGIYEFDISIQSACCNKTVHVVLQVSGEVIADRGDGDLWRLSRLRWLNSTIGMDRGIAKDYVPMEVKSDGLVSCLGREVRFNQLGLPSGIQSFFSNNGDEITDKAVDILSCPVEMRISSDQKPLQWFSHGVDIEKAGEGCVIVNSRMSTSGLSATNETVMEYDGHIETIISITAEEDIRLDNAQLLVRIRKEAASYMMGMGLQGGFCPDSWNYTWNEEYANNLVWLGSPNAGLQVKLKHTEDVWEVYNYKKQGVPDSWSNQGKGGCLIHKRDSDVELDAFTGVCKLMAGESLTFRFSLLITPLKKIDSNAHWQQRYHHIDTWKEDIPSLEEAVKVDATIVNLHQGGALNQFINYPFLKSKEIQEQTKKAHRLGLKYKIYYTVRELSSRAVELWMLRSLGDEVLRIGEGFRMADHFVESKNQQMTGGPWLIEHLQDGFVPAWQQILKDGDYDSAVSINGLTRWHNHYLEGLAWLMEKDGVDGIYLDGVGYDRQIMKRVRKAMDSAKDGCLIDFHSGNDFDPRYGLNSPMNAYLELMPSVDSLWLGEGYDYEKESPEYWLTEVSGIPFGLMGDMLSRGGNPWRGMVFGMTCRYGWQQGGNPVPLWQFWKSFGMDGVKMHGWWSEGCPVTTDNHNIKATVFQKTGKTLISIASWAEKTTSVKLHIDWDAIGLSSETGQIQVPYIESFQEEISLNMGDGITVEPRRGWLLIVSNKEGVENAL